MNYMPMYLFMSHMLVLIKASKHRLVLGHGSILGSVLHLHFKGPSVSYLTFQPVTPWIHRDLSLTDSPSMVRTFAPQGFPGMPRGKELVNAGNIRDEDP